MNLYPLLLIGLGGMAGASARYLVSTWAAARFGTAFPFGTFLINLSGSFLIGLLLTVVANNFGGSGDSRLFLAIGVLGAYTTFSTFTYETMALIRQGDFRPALVNMVGSVVLGVVGVAGGIALASLVGGLVG